MSYDVSRNNEMFSGSMHMANPDGQSLALQHLEYTMTIETNRAALTQRALGNTAILMGVAGEIVNDNPAATDPVKQILVAYLDATGRAIRNYGVPNKYR